MHSRDTHGQNSSVVPNAVLVLSISNKISGLNIHTHIDACINTQACIFCLLIHKTFAHATLSDLGNVEMFSILHGKSQPVPPGKKTQTKNTAVGSRDPPVRVTHFLTLSPLPFSFVVGLLLPSPPVLSFVN